MKDLLATSYKLLEEVAKFKTSDTIKRVSISHLILVGIPPSWFCLLRTGVGGFFLFNGKNPLSVTRVIC